MSDMTRLQQLAQTFIEWSALTLLFMLGVIVAIIIVLYIVDVRQTRHTIRRNYPVIGRFRYLFEHLGEFFRQYFFAMDREELPFKSRRSRLGLQSRKKMDTTIAFGSTRALTQAGEPIFLNSPFPTLSDDIAESRSVTIGEGYCKEPYTTRSLIHISGMSYGAISRPAVRALSKGAKEANIWLNTGEGALSEYHLEGGCDLVFQNWHSKVWCSQRKRHALRRKTD